MQLRRLLLAVLILAVSVVVAAPAFADTVTLTYEGHQGVGSINGSPLVGYPYYMSINGSSSFVPMMCDSFDNDITKGQSWQATAMPFLQGIANSMFGASMVLDYKAAGLIFESMLSNLIDRNTAQWAIWGLFSSNAVNTAYFQANPNFAAIESQYLALAANAPNSAFNGLVLYTPLNAKPGSGPQEFIGFSTVPEPSSLMLLGTGIVALAGAARRKFAKV